MLDSIPGHKLLKRQLLKSIETQCIAHAQLFVDTRGYSALPLCIAYAQQILCHNTPTEDSSACFIKCKKLSHPDLHFIFPVASNSKVKSHPMSHLFLDEWRNFIEYQPFGSLFDWYKAIDIGNKQGLIGVDDALHIIQTLSLKPYESTHRVLILWMPEKLNIMASNKLLKIIEEPPRNTIFLLATEHEEHIIQTIRSRCQTTYLNPISPLEIQKHLETKGLKPKSSQHLSKISKEDFKKSLNILEKNPEHLVFEKWFTTLVRIAFSAKGNKSSILNLISWSHEVSKSGRETQKYFLLYCIEIFRQALLKNYKIEPLVYIKTLDNNFLLEKFMPFVHSHNIMKIFKLFDSAIYDIERNANAKIIFTDLSILLTRYIHIKEHTVA